MTSTTRDLSRDLLWDVEDSLQKNSLNVHFNSLSNHCNKKAQNREVAGNLKQKSTATIWRENCTSLSRRHRADLVEKRGSVLVCNLEALTRVAGRSGPDVSRDIKKLCIARLSKHRSRDIKAPVYFDMNEKERCVTASGNSGKLRDFWQLQ